MTAEDEADAAAAAAADERLGPLQKILVAGAAWRVQRIAREMRRVLGISVEDCEGAGYEALARAALRYDPASGVPFMAFAYLRVRGAMIDAARAAYPGRRRLHRLARVAEAATCVTEGHAPLAGDPRTLTERVTAAQAMIRDVTAAAALVRAAEVESVGDPRSVDVEDWMVDEETRRRVLAALERCPPDERALFEGLYFRDETMAEVGAEQGISAATVSRRHARALRRLALLLGEAPP